MTETRRCPYGPCQATPGVTLYLAQPGDTVPTLPIIDPHPLNAEHALQGEACPAGLLRIPISAHDRSVLDYTHERYQERARRAENKPTGKPKASPKGGPVGIPEHSLTPHPTERAQWWFITGPERLERAQRAKDKSAGPPGRSATPHPIKKAQRSDTGPERADSAMTSVTEVAAQIDRASLLMAEAQSLVFQASAKNAEAHETLGAIIGHVSAPLGLIACAAARDMLNDAHTLLHAGIEQNTEYRGSL